LEKTLWWSFFGAAKKNENKAASGKETWNTKMTFTGTLIESLMATVERAERRAHSEEALFAEQMVVELLVEPWINLGRITADYDSKFLGVA
jgi:hypothetical protein